MSGEIVKVEEVDRVPLIKVSYSEGGSAFKLFTGQDDDPDAIRRSRIFASLGVPKEAIHFGDSSHREEFDAVVKEKRAEKKAVNLN